MDRKETRLLQANDSGVAAAARILQLGGLVAFPTETVYGLGADARNDAAVARIFEAKGRPQFNPLIVHVASAAAAEEIAEFDATARRLASAFWPGPLTLVLPVRPEAGISALISAGLPSVAIRVPQHPLAQRLLAAFGGPVAAPSANPSGRISPTLAQHVIDGLSGRIEAVLDGGACGVGVESTIVGLLPEPTLLRAGGLPAEAIEACLGRALSKAKPSARPNAPGQLVSHYAPKAALRLNATGRAPGELLLGFGAVDCDLNLSSAGDLTEAAANLFRYLHDLDARPSGGIAVSPIPDHGLGRAINDRLTRAAAPRT
ncbi:MAG: L-threonylcarbamoyladenylate synthase [Paracoccaceae bacterium]